MIRILVAEDFDLLREDLCGILNQQPDMTVAGSAGSGTAGLAGLAAGLAAGGLVLEALLGVELLLAGGKHEFSAAVAANQRLVLIHDRVSSDPMMLCIRLTWSLPPHSPAGALAPKAMASPLLALSARRLAGLTSKPHHAHGNFPRLRGSFCLRLASTCNHGRGQTRSTIIPQGRQFVNHAARRSSRALKRRSM